ncbi:MAG: DUF2334 domain-containing protein [Flavobacterium sp.]|nr:DUF2334 domain-containing protein [Flavobacterium sp.]
MIVKNWLPDNKKAAICFTIDDLHPANVHAHGYDAGGDLNNGVFGKVNWLLNRHPNLKVTLFTTADWREISPTPTRKLLAKIPFFRDLFYLTKIQQKGTLQIDKFQDFVDFYSNHKQVEIALHGLHHVHKGLKIPVEFQEDSYPICNKKIKEIIRIFEKSKVKYVRGFTPPAWNAPENLMKALVHNNIKFLASARDVKSEISKTAVNYMSGRKNVSIVYPELIENGQMVHFASNFQATNDYNRAREIIENNGLLAIKAHMIKEFHGHVSLDGVDDAYMQYLDKLLTEIETKYGDQIWWTSMGEIANKILEN